MNLAEIKAKVEKCIIQFGKDFKSVSDKHFWYEYDAQFRLMCSLSREIERDLSFEEPRLVHAHYPAQNGQRYDIAVFDIVAARDIVNRIFCYNDWHRKLRERKDIAAVIEIAFAFVKDGSRLEGNIEYDYREDIKSALRRLTNDENRNQLWANKNLIHYIVICCVTSQFTDIDNQRYPADIKSVKSARSWVSKKAQEIYKEAPFGLKVYWTSDHKLDEPDFIFPKITN